MPDHVVSHNQVGHGAGCDEISRMTTIIRFLFSLVALGSVLLAPSLHAQAVLKDTSLGQDQNDERDYINSLQSGPQKFGKGEKKVQINARELKSKSINDGTFGGSLLNMGINDGAPKLDETKVRSAQTEADKNSAASKQQQTAIKKESGNAATSKDSAAAEKQPGDATQPADNDQSFSNLSMTATLGDSLVQQEKAAEEAKTTSSDTHNNKDQTAGTADSDKTSAASSPEPKPNGDH